MWYKYLSTIRISGEEAQQVSEAQLAEAMEMLKKILATREKFLGDDHIATGEAKYTLGLLQLLVSLNEPALENIGGALVVYEKHLGGDHPSTRDVRDVLVQLEEAKVFSQAGE